MLNVTGFPASPPIATARLVSKDGSEVGAVFASLDQIQFSLNAAKVPSGRLTQQRYQSVGLSMPSQGPPLPL